MYGRFVIGPSLISSFLSQISKINTANKPVEEEEVKGISFPDMYELKYVQHADDLT